MISFQNVTKIYESNGQKVTAVDRVTFTVKKGDICVLLGPSGCGKTTLLRMVNRLISVTSGQIEVNGQAINTLDPIELRRSIGYVIQQVGLFPNMTIEENIYVVPKMLGWDQSKMQKRYHLLMEMMGLDPNEYRNRYPWELSGGQQQRIGVARALAADPPVMLMDEPFGALDPIIREHLQDEFLRIQKDVKKTILFVSHDVNEAIRLGDTIAILNEGKLMQHGSPSDILLYPKNEFVQQFMGKDRALKRLNLLTINHLIDKLSHFSSRRGDLLPTNSTPTVTVHTDLWTALSAILSAQSDRIRVVNSDDTYIGWLCIEDFNQLGIDPSEGHEQITEENEHAAR